LHAHGVAQRLHQRRVRHLIDARLQAQQAVERELDAVARQQAVEQVVPGGDGHDRVHARIQRRQRQLEAAAVAAADGADLEVFGDPAVRLGHELELRGMVVGPVEDGARVLGLRRGIDDARVGVLGLAVAALVETDDHVAVERQGLRQLVHGSEQGIVRLEIAVGRLAGQARAAIAVTVQHEREALAGATARQQDRKRDRGLRLRIGAGIEVGGNVVGEGFVHHRRGRGIGATRPAAVDCMRRIGRTAATGQHRSSRERRRGDEHILVHEPSSEIRSAAGCTKV
jgi:hypothetical protein